MKPLSFHVTEEVLQLGVKILTARITGIKNTKTTPELDEYIQSELEKIKNSWIGKDYKEDPVIAGFKNLHTKIGRSNRNYPASPEVLLRLFLEKDRFPRINSVVDIYNLVSLKTRLALGAHNVDNVEGNISLKLTRGDETFIPLGSKEALSVPANEYAYIDDGNNIICRMEVLQVEPTKTTLDSNDIFLIVQGNENTDNEYMQAGANEVLELLQKFCGGDFIFLNELTK